MNESSGVSDRPIRLNLGCGETYLEDWVNIDAPQAEGSHGAFRVDLTADISTLEYPAETVEEILMNAVFEHFQRHEALRILRKFYCWLKNEGKVTIVVPDFWGSIAKLKKSKSVAERAFWYRHLFGPQDHPHYGNHLDGFEKQRLKETFNVVGFTDLKIRSFGAMPFLKVEAIKHAPATSDLVFKKRAADYLIFHEYRAVPGSCFAEWLKALAIDPEEIGFTPPKAVFSTQKENLKTILKKILKRIVGAGYYEKMKRSRKHDHC